MASSEARHIELKETRTEYLLYIPIAQKDRAKGIAGRQWDPGRKCWVYPKTRTVYEALVSEFGDELGILAPQLPPRQPGKAQTTRDDAPDAARLIRELNAAQTALAEAQATLADRERLLKEVRRSLQTAHQDLELLRSLPKTTRDESTLWDRAKATAKKTARQSRSFAAVVDGLSPVGTFALEMQKSLERALRKRLGLKDLRTPLFDLLALAREQEVLPDEALDLAHTIRRQRNMVAHESVDLQTREGRILLVLFASAVLWPYLTKE